ncbi:MAG TPA: MogA/MoaB family molybdenum cofactor biosynthesis protein [Gemmatimonadaceae bacterium]|jgi:molybdenum cofactor biosynthesis protein B|nr:MogA/MoaB family molybdenum cofactor biosynthesis protein [Gemmatimonadaceae bacterium]
MTLPPGTAEHRVEGDALPPIRCAVLAVSDSRTLETDESGKRMQRLLVEAGHSIADYTLLKNDELQVRGHVRALIGRSDLDAVLITGGTGLGSKDRTVEAVKPLLEKELPGFGEIFRMISFQDQIGAAAILSRALAGSANGKFVVSMPGSKAAVELALTRIILPELRHAIRELRR